MLKRVRVTIFLPWNSNKYYIFWVCVCSLRYPACKAHASYYIVACGLSGSTIFFQIISQTARFSWISVEHKMCILVFSTTCLWNVSHSKKNSEKYYYKCTFGLHVKYPFLLSHFNETWISSTDFQKKKNYELSNFTKIRPVVAQFFHVDGQTEGRIRWHPHSHFPRRCSTHLKSARLYLNNSLVLAHRRYIRSSYNCQNERL